MRTVASALGGIVLVLVLSGCFVIKSTSSSQTTHAAPVKLSTTMCVSGSPDCSDGGNSDTRDPDGDDSETVQMQALYAVRLPVGTSAPNSFPSTPGSGRVSTTFTRSATFEAELQKYEPAGAGERWHGYLSGQFGYSDDPGSPATILAEITVPLPRPEQGPFVTPLRWRPISGARIVDAGNGLPASRPVACSNEEDPADVFSGYSETNQAGISIVCIDSPSPSAARGFLDAPTRDFGVTGTAATIPAGGTSTLTFLATWSGAVEAGQTYDLAVAGGAPGGSVSIDRASVTPTANSTTPVIATVSIPAGTPPGVYDVTVSASRAGKDTRVGISKVTVPAPAAEPTPTPTPGATPTPTPTPVADTTKPRITAAKLTPTRPRTGRRASLGLTLSENATVLVTVERAGAGRRVGSRCSATARRGKRCTRWTSVGTVRTTLAAGARKVALPAKLRGRALRRGRHRLRIVATDAARNASATTTVTFTVVR